MGVLTLQKWILDSDGFGKGSDADGFGRIPGPQIWKSPSQVVNDRTAGVDTAIENALNKLFSNLLAGAYTRSLFSST